jgi:hypothetical protein
MVIRTPLAVAFVWVLFALHSPVRAQSLPSQSATVRSTSLLEQAWSVDGVRGGVVGDLKTGLIYTATTSAEIVERDLTGAIRRRIALPPGPAMASVATLRLARVAGDKRPTLLAFGIWSQAVRAFDLDGRQLWSYPNAAEPGPIGIDDVNVVDLDGDGTDEVIIGFNGSTGVRVIDSKGQLVWQSTSIGNVWNVSGGDVLGDGRAQVITTSAQGLVHVFSSNGSERKDIHPAFYANMVRVGKTAEAAGAATIFAMGDVGGFTTIAALSGNGSARWSLQLPSSVQASVRGAWLARMKPWLAVGVRDGAVHVIDVERGTRIGSIEGQNPMLEVGWAENDGNGSPLLLVSGGGTLTAYRIIARTR